MQVIQSPLFYRKVKKITKKEKVYLDKAIKKIYTDPNIGKRKKGVLKGINVYKFKIANDEYLLSYRFQAGILELITFGQHENYYRDLKKYLNSR